MFQLAKISHPFKRREIKEHSLSLLPKKFPLFCTKNDLKLWPGKKKYIEVFYCKNGGL